MTQHDTRQQALYQGVSLARNLCYLDRHEDAAVVAAIALAAFEERDAEAARSNGELVTDGGEETVWVVSNAGGQGDVFHKSPDCRNIKAESTVLAKPRSIVGALDRCQTADCWGDHANDHGSRRHYHAALESDPDEVIPEPDDRLITDGGDQVDACPHCDSSRVRRSRDDRTPAAERWTCYACRERFSDDEVITRSPKASGSGAASELSALEPDDLATDGGERP
jgi:hypothetical protein